MNPRNQFLAQNGVSQRTITDIKVDAPPAAGAGAGAAATTTTAGDQKQTTNVGNFSLKLFVMGASDLAKFDTIGSSDPFCVVSLIDDAGKPVTGFTKTTKVVKNNLNPEWKEVFAFADVPAAATHRLEFAVFDWDRGSKAEFMGRLVIPNQIIKRIGQKVDEPLALRCKLVSRPLPSGVGTEPEEHKLKGDIFVIMGTPDTDLSKLPAGSLNPPLMSSVTELDEAAMPGSSPGRKSFAHYGTLGRHKHDHRERTGTLKPGDVKEAKDDEDEKRSEKDELETPEKKERREKIREEIISTEKSYVASLEVLENNFIKPLKKDAATIGLSDEQLQTLFSNMETLFTFHQMFLKELTGNPTKPATVIIKFGDYFKMYTQYLNGYEKILAELNNLRTHKKFQAFLANMRNNIKKMQGGLDLMSYMIMPVQRVPRYVLLLRELKKNSPSTNEDFESINQALGKIKAIATHINNAKKQMEQMSKLIDVQSRIGEMGGTTLVAPSRWLIREGILQTIENKGLFGSIKQSIRIFFLFNDILVWCKQDYTFQGVMNLAAATLTEQSEKTSCGFELTTSVKNLILHCKDEHEKKLWLQELTEAIHELQEKRNATRAIRENVERKKASSGHGDRLAAHALLTQKLATLSERQGTVSAEEQQALAAQHAQQLQAEERKASLSVSSSPAHSRGPSGSVAAGAGSAPGASPSSAATAGAGAAPAAGAAAAGAEGGDAGGDVSTAQAPLLKGVALPQSVMMSSKFKPRQIQSRGARKAAAAGGGDAEGVGES